MRAKRTITQLGALVVLGLLTFYFSGINILSTKERVAGGATTISRVVDGDTVVIASGEKVRYIGIDTPEVVDPRKPVQCFGEEASRRNKELVDGKTVRLEKDVEDEDQYGRLLRYVWVANSSEEVLVNLELVKEGYAHIYTFPPNVKYYDDFLAAEREARKAKRGLWEKCI